ncbi:MAG: STAS domain-containing protein [Planctomycetes bacterium]|nr:STAS domain-containing protein [Planctomycetota bacterium]
MSSARRLFHIERQDDTVVVALLSDAGEFEYERLIAEAQEAFEVVEGSPDVKHAVVDFEYSDYVGSTALGFLLKLWKRVANRGGRMALCNLSKHEREILAATRLDTFWDLCESREEALEVVRSVTV